MTDIIEFVLLIIFCVFVCGISSVLYKRLFLLNKLKKLSKIEGVELTFLNNPWVSIFRVSKTADILIKIYGNPYFVRIYNGGSPTKAVHFANEKFSVCYSRLKSVTYTARGRFLNVKGFNFGGNVRVVEKLTPKNEYESFTEILVFNPAPSEVSFVVKEKNSIKAAFTGDLIYGRKIFTASTLEIFVDREARRIRDERRMGVFEW